MPHTRKKHRPRPHYLVNLTLGVAVLILFGYAGARVAGFSSAASSNPYGSADYCTLENNQTVIYGWAADPDAGSLSDPSVTINAGGQAVTVQTNRSGYRDNAINAWIDQNRTGDPKPGTYGFRATLSGLYKSTRNIITGTVLNVGPGSSVILTINDSAYVDGDPGKPFFQGDVIPDACLGVAPAPTPSTPAPTNAAAPSKTQAAGTPAPQQTSVTHGNDADAIVTAGTLAASVAVQADGASSAHISYGTSPIKLDQSTSDQPVDPKGSTTIAISGLDPSIAYSYQVIRTYSGGKTAASAIENFTTLGYVAAVHFVDSHTEGIQGIQASLDDGSAGKKTSDDQGTVEFTNVPTGNHTISYLYRNQKFTKQVTVNSSSLSPDQAAASHVLTLDFSINIEQAAALAAKPASRGSSPLVTIIIVLIIVAGVVAIVVRALRKKRQQETDWYESPPSIPQYQATPQAPSQPSPAAPIPPMAPPNPPYTTRPASHAGESLKDLVLRSMAEEADRKAGGDKPS